MEISLKLHTCYLTRSGKIVKITNRYRRSSSNTVIFSDRDGCAYTESGIRIGAFNSANDIEEELSMLI